MEEQLFENNIKEAFKRANRGLLKEKMSALEAEILEEENTFERNIKEAARRIERAKLKNCFQEIEQTIADSEANKTIPLPITTKTAFTWKYAVAACLLIGLFGTWFVMSDSLDDKNVLANIDKPKTHEPTKEKIVNNKPPSNSKNTSNKTTTITNETFDLEIKTEGLGFGGGVNKLSTKIFYDKNVPVSRYTFRNGQLNIYASRKTTIKSAIANEDILYLNIKDKYYAIEKHDKPQLLTPTADVLLLEKLQKIDAGL